VIFFFWGGVDYPFKQRHS